MARLTHIDTAGKASMVDVSTKAATDRIAIAKGVVRLAPETLQLITENKLAKGDVLSAARIAGIMAAKKTSALIPLCHPLGLSSVSVEFTFYYDTSSIEIEATAKVHGATGVEMEALTAVSVAALTLYDMCKAVDRAIRITDIRLVHKSGGKSGVWTGS
ncbi:MAG: cyclic pyranopterin monophosphate synthase MoaC [Alphaproteobacteria bacterium]